MVNDPSAGAGGPSAPPRKRSFADRWKKDENRVGLKPAQGWRERNLRYLGDVLIPTLLKPRAPRHDITGVPGTEHHEIGVTWLGHAGFLVQMEGVNILIDPVWALWLGPVKRTRHPTLYAHDMPRIDLVLITHAHFDHLHLPSLKRIACNQPVVVPRGVGSVVKRCDFSSIIELDTWGSFQFRDLRISLTPARHWGARLIHDTHRHFGGYLIESTARGLYHCGDSAMFDGFREIGGRASIDVALMPIGAYEPPSGRPVHMNPEEALDAFQMIGAQTMIPMHYDTFPISGEPMHEPALRLQTAAQDRGLAERVRMLMEGETAVL